MRLNVGVLGAKEFFRPLNGESLYYIYIMAAVIPPRLRVSFGVFVRHYGPLGLEHFNADEILARYQLQIIILSFGLVKYGPVNVGIFFLQTAHNYFPLFSFNPDSMSLICLTRRICRSSLCSVLNHIFSISLALSKSV